MVRAGVLLALVGCANRFEVKGDAALAQGNQEAAVAAYEEGLAMRPIMDFEYEALRAKRARLLATSYGPKITVAMAEQTAAGRASAIAALRVEAQTKRLPAGLRAEIDAALVAAIERLPEEPGTVAEMLALLDTVSGDGRLTIAVADAIGSAASLGIPEVKAAADLDALGLLLELRAQMRQRGVPPTSDAKIDGGFSALGSRPIPVVGAADAKAVAERAIAMRERGEKLGAPAAALALADRYFEAAAPHLVEAANRAVAGHRYVAALTELQPIAVRAPDASVVRTRFRAIATEGLMWHLAEAGKLPAGYRRLVQLQLARSMASGSSGAATQATEQRTALQADWETVLAIAVTGTPSSDCSGVWSALAFDKTGKAVKAPVSLGCSGDESSSRTSDTVSYEYEVEYFEQENVKVGSHRERVQVGTHDEACTQESSVPGTVWQGVCKVPDYEWKVIDDYELQNVRKTRMDKGQQTYEKTQRTVNARVSGTAQLTWDDGTVLATPIDVTATREQTSWDVSYPGEKLVDAPRRSYQTDDRSITPASLRDGLGSNARSAIASGLTNQVRIHRAKLARTDGRQAPSPDAAGEAYVRSAMIGFAVEAEAATWFSETHGLDAATAFSLLHANAPRFDEPAKRVRSAADPYQPTPISVALGTEVVADSMYERDVKKEGTQGDEGLTSILSPVERLGAWMSLIPFSVKSRDLEDQYTVAAMLEFNSSPIGKALGLRYGVTYFDDLVSRIGVGIGQGGDYTSGESEGRLGWGWGVSYHGMLGYRTHHVGVFAGAGGGYTYFRAGDDKSRGVFAEPIVRMTFRPWGVGILAVEAQGGVSLGDTARRDAISVAMPFNRYKTGQWKLWFEQTSLPTEARAVDGTTRMDLGRQPLRIFGVAAGGRF